MNKMYTVFMDGASWCATNEDFRCLSEDFAGFGESPIEALQDLIDQENK